MAPNILIIDDDDAVRYILSTMLRQKGYDVRTAYSVDAALAEIEEQLPDLICCDLMMPEKDGIDFLEHRQQNAALREVPVIIISAVGEENLSSQAIQLGADARLGKPLSSARLLETVSSLLEAESAT